MHHIKKYHKPPRPRDPVSQPPAEHGVLATTRYVPRLRLERSEVLAQHRWMAPGLRALAKGRRAIASWDEDSVTMAVEAGRQLQRALPGATAVELTLASTTLPFAERLNAGIVAAALGPRPRRGAARRGLERARRAHASSRPRCAVRQATARSFVLAAERRIARPASAQEMIFGDGAAGALVGTGAAIATLRREPQHPRRPGGPLPRVRPASRLRLGGALGARRGLHEDRRRHHSRLPVRRRRQPQPTSRTS